VNPRTGDTTVGAGSESERAGGPTGGMEAADPASSNDVARLAGGLAHEIKNPLSTISLNLELLAEDLAEPQSSRDRRMLQRVKVLQRACTSLNEILEDFLKFVRLRPFEWARVDLNDVVREFIEVFTPQARGQQVELSPHLDPDLPAVRLDAALFRQVLWNLGLNALQAMPGGGVLELQTHRGEGCVRLDLIDNGTGMDAAVLARIFEPFFSTKRNGTGLGLPSVKKIVNDHGGTVAVASVPGKGTRFTIVLPAAAE